MSITTAVFPVAGLGTRFLPVTKAAPKEMLPILDKPVIQYVVEEAVAAGIKQLVFVTSHTKRAIEDYFDSNYELESHLSARGKYEALAKVQNILPDDVSFIYVRQPSPRGLGDAVLCARSIVGNQAFAVLLADDVIDCGTKGCLQSMVDVHQRTKASVLAVEAVAPQETGRYGIVCVDRLASDLDKVTGIVEKPAPEHAPSNLAVTGRYILTPRIFELLARTEQGVGGEIQLTDAISSLLTEQSVMAYRFQGKRYDCGSRQGLLQATLHYAYQDPELKRYLKAMCSPVHKQ